VREVPAFGIEARRWTVVFHRKAENRFFGLIAFGKFKHVSAFAWIPELGIWTFYDVGFRRSRITHFADGHGARQAIGAIMAGNYGVTVEAKNDALPLVRLGFFCTTGVKHLIGLRSGALRPDALFRHLVASGGIVSDDAAQRTADPGRSEPRG
jgi:hypothetical protein